MAKGMEGIPHLQKFVHQFILSTKIISFLGYTHIIPFYINNKYIHIYSDCLAYLPVPAFGKYNVSPLAIVGC